MWLVRHTHAPSSSFLFLSWLCSLLCLFAWSKWSFYFRLTTKTMKHLFKDFNSFPFFWLLIPTHFSILTLKKTTLLLLNGMKTILPEFFSLILMIQLVSLSSKMISKIQFSSITSVASILIAATFQFPTGIPW